MTLIADILLISGAFGAALYCMILSRRLNRLSKLDGGLGKAIADLNAQVTDLSRTLQESKASAAASADTLGELTDRAEKVAASLETILHDAAEVSQEIEPAATPRPRAPKPASKGAVGAQSEGKDDRPTMPAFVRGRAMRTAAE